MRQFMALEQGVTISNAIIDVQVKRIHEYKRQQMLALYIIWKYLDINGNRPKHPVTIIFGAEGGACLHYRAGHHPSDLDAVAVDCKRPRRGSLPAGRHDRELQRHRRRARDPRC